MTSLSIYFAIGKNPDEYYDSFRIGSYFPLSNSLLLNSISHLFYDLDNLHFHIFCIGQKKNFMLFQQINNKSYFQLGNEKHELYNISSDQNIEIHLFKKVDSLFSSLLNDIKVSSSQNILIILQDYGSLYKFSNYNYVSLLKRLSFIDKNFFIYNESSHSSSLIDLFKKNNDIWLYFQELYKNNPNLRMHDYVHILYCFSKIQLDMFLNFKDNISTYFPNIVDFVSQISEKSFKFLFTKSFRSFNKQLLFSIDQNLNKKFFISIPIEQLGKFFFVSKIFKDKNINFDHFVKQLKSHKVKTLADLYIIKSLDLFVKGDLDKYVPLVYDYFTKQNYDIFIDIEKRFFDFTLFDKDEFNYQKIVYFFNQYHNINVKTNFFKFEQNIEIVSSTNSNNKSVSYCSTHANTTTKVFLNSLSFAYFIRNAFFCCKDHFFEFDNSFDDFISFDLIKKENIYYAQYEKQTGKIYPCHLIYPHPENKFKFDPSPSLPKKIAAIRFITKHTCNYFLKYQDMEFPTLNFSCDFLRMPSNYFINFISLSILPDYLYHNLKLNNDNFLNI